MSTDMTARDSSIRARDQYRSSSMKSSSGKICLKVASEGCQKTHHEVRQELQEETIDLIPGLIKRLSIQCRGSGSQEGLAPS